MKELALLHQLVYLDRDYIAGAYEALTGVSPSTQITKNEGKKAGAQIPFFSAEVNAGETRSFALSSLGMLEAILPKLSEIPEIDISSLQIGAPSRTGWLHGEMTVSMVNLKRRKSGEEEKLIASDKYFRIRSASGLLLALITTDNYFASGVDAFTRILETVISRHQVPVKVLVRIYPAISDFKEWISVPLIILEDINTQSVQSD